MEFERSKIQNLERSNFFLKNLKNFEKVVDSGNNLLYNITIKRKEARFQCIFLANKRINLIQKTE